MAQRTCSACANVFEPTTSRQRFCSKRCCRENSRAKPKPECSLQDCDRRQIARGLCKMHWKREHGSRTKHPIACQTCGCEWLSDRKDGRFCSDACKGLAYRRSRAIVGPVEPSLCWLPDRHPARQPTPRIRTWYAGRCSWCQVSFVDNQPTARFCSPRCEGSAARARRGRFIIPPQRRLAIYERDNWTCQLCMDLVDASLPASDMWAATLDHIECQSWTLVPDHSDANLRLAHRWCNSVRGDERHASASALRISRVA